MRRVGLIYDFDLTLSEEYQQFPILRKFAPAIERKYGITRPEDYFPQLCERENIEIGVGAMQQVLNDAQDIFPGLSNETMRQEYAPLIRLSPGLPGWFGRINEYASSLELTLEHHVVSAGFRPLIEGTALAAYLASIRSGTFIDDGKTITKIKTIVDPKNKREEIIKICKGQDMHDDIPIGHYRINYDRVIVVGDGHSDKRKFNFIQERGGIAIGVYTQGDEERLQMAKKELSGRVHYLVPRDYSAASPLERVVAASLELIAQRTCTFDYRMVRALKLGHLQNRLLTELTEEHWAGCADCQKRSEKTQILPSPP